MDQYKRKDSFNLKKPKFIKMSEVKPGRHCYNVYATVWIFIDFFEPCKILAWVYYDY